MIRDLVGLLAFVIICGTALPAVAQAPSEGLPTPQVFDELVACRELADDSQRLACYDRQVAAMQAAEENEEIVVVDRGEIREAERGLFGLRLPSIRLFDSGSEESRVNQIESTITAVAGGRRSRPWSFRLENGSLWLQVDSEILSHDPRPGHAVLIERAALGSFQAEIDGMRPIRVRRVE